MRFLLGFSQVYFGIAKVLPNIHGACKEICKFNSVENSRISHFNFLEWQKHSISLW